MKTQEQTPDCSASGPKVSVTSVSFSKSLVLRKEMERVFPDVSFNERGCRLSEPELIEFLKDADAAVIGTEQINDQVLKHTPQLKIVSKYGVGLDNIDEEALRRRNITLGWQGGINRRSVAELALCFMLGLCRNVFGAGFKLKQGKWEKDGGRQLTGKTIGIIGCGNTGSEVIQLLAPFQCTLLVRDIVDKSEFCREHNAAETSLEDLVTRSDFISLHVPLTPLTTKMVNADFLHRMKATACLINTSRGDVVDQEALKAALKQDAVAGAALDVFAEEPPKDPDFLSLPNLMVTPHIGGNAKEAVEAMGRCAIAHLIEFFKNHTPVQR